MKKFVSSLIFISLLCSSIVKAQNWSNAADDNDISFGFVFQYVSAEYKILKNPNWREPFYDLEESPVFPITSSLNSISSLPKPGFGLGFLVAGRVTEHFRVQSTPALVLSDRIVRYEYVPQADKVGESQTRVYESTIDKQIQATLFQLPLSLKFQSDKVKNVRAYILGGGKISLDLASKKKNFDDGEPALNKFLKVNKNLFSYEAAIGLDFYFEYIKISPEIKISYTPNDVLQHNNTAFSTPIDKLTQRQLTFSLIFQ